MDLVDIARRAAARAAAYLRGVRPPDPATWTEKSRHDFVTDVDRSAEELIRSVLTAEAPGSVVVGEELSPGTSTTGDVVWVVDPLDGTTNFLHGYPQYAVSIGCAVRGTLVAGVVHDVPRDLVYHAAAGSGAWQGNERIHVSTVASPARALVGTGFPFKDLTPVSRYLRQFEAVLRTTAGIRRAGCAAIDFADLAAGRLDAFWELSLAPWDVAAGVVLVREAGGVVSAPGGAEYVLAQGPIVAGNPVMHRWIIEVLSATE